jgi:hypothetical protein
VKFIAGSGRKKLQENLVPYSIITGGGGKGTIFLRCERGKTSGIHGVQFSGILVEGIAALHMLCDYFMPVS